jgi:hypothetical protein
MTRCARQRVRAPRAQLLPSEATPALEAHRLLSLTRRCPGATRAPRNHETPQVKVKGKAAIDVICNPLGKSGGALIQQFMIIGFGSLAASTPYLGIILLAIVLLWISAANSLAGQFAELQKVCARACVCAGGSVWVLAGCTLCVCVCWWGGGARA